MQLPRLDPELKTQIIQKGKRGFSDGSRPVTVATNSPSLIDADRGQFALEEFASPWPSLVEMKRSTGGEWAIASVKHKITELKREHRQQLAKATKYQEHEYLQMIDDEYLAFDPTADWGNDWIEEAKSFLHMSHQLQDHDHANFISSLRYSHIVTLKPLYEKLQQLLILEEKAKQQRAKHFPKSSQGWREMDTRDAKLKVAKFLLMDKRRQDEMVLRETDWRSDKIDVDRVVLEFHTNVVFSEEVKNFVKEIQTTDPRRRG